MLEELVLDEETPYDHHPRSQPALSTKASPDKTLSYSRSTTTNGAVNDPAAWQRQISHGRSERRNGPLTFRFSRALLPPRRRRRAHRVDDDESYNKAVTAFFTTKVMGGVRGDPFNSFPIEPKDCVPQAVDQFVQSFIPERILRPFHAVPGIEQLAHSYFQLVISDVCMFEATVAHVEASKMAAQGVLTPTKEVLHHQGQALTHLQERLADPVKRLEDLTFHIIINIMGTHFFFGQLEEHHAHLAGLWSLIEMRGGIDSLGWDGSLKQAIETVTSYVQFQFKVETPASTPSPAVATEPPLSTLEYPSHPFPPDLSAEIAKLPTGFSSVALNRKLSLQTIDLLLDTNDQDQFQRNVVPSRASPHQTIRRRLYTADKALHLLRNQHMSDLERMIVGGILAYAIQCCRLDAPQRTTLYNEPLRNFLSETAKYTFVNYEHPALLWVVLCLAAIQQHITEDATRVDFFHHTVLRFKQTTKWENVERTMKQFCWTEERLREWKSAWEDAVARHQPKGYAQSLSGSAGGGSSRGPSRSPDAESTVVGSAMTPYSSEGVEWGLGVKMEG